MSIFARRLLIVPLVAALIVAAAYAIYASRQAAEAGDPTVVTNTSDSDPGSLRYVIANNPADTVITFDGSLAGQTIELTSDGLRINKNLTIIGGGITISGKDTYQVFDITDEGVSVDLIGVTITLGRGSYGAAIGVEFGAHLSLEDSRVVNNHSTGYGVIGVLRDSSATVTNVAVINNTSSGYASGFFVEGTVNMTNVTISGNSASETGAALMMGSGNDPDAYSSVANLQNVTISNNSSGPDQFDSAIEAFRSNDGSMTVNLSNTIIANQAQGADCDESGSDWNSLGYNIDSDDTCRLNGPSDQPSTDPQLLALALNAPGASETHAIQQGSPAHNNGDDTVCPFSDQRGVERGPEAPCDIGALEVAEVITPTPSPTPSATATGTPTGTATATPTLTPTVTATPTAPPAGFAFWGDTNCNGGIQAKDALPVMAFRSGIGAGIGIQGECPAVGADIGDYGWGDYDCNNIIDYPDALLVLKYFIGLPEAIPDCPDIGETVQTG